MPILRNWSEELVWEWLSLRGYLTDVGVPVATGGRGGRKEADVLGAKVKGTNKGKTVLEIYHVEIGSLTRNLLSNVETVVKKFSDEIIKSVKDRFTKRLGTIEEVEYHKVYVDTWASNSKAKKLESDVDINREGIKIWTMKDLYGEVLRIIEEWKATPGYLVKSDLMVTLPESYWILKLLDDLRRNNLLVSIPTNGESATSRVA